MNDYKLPIKVELVILTTQVIHAKEIHIEVLQQEQSNWQLPSLWLEADINAKDGAELVTKGVGLSKPEFVGCFTEINRSNESGERYISLVYRLLVARDDIQVDEDNRYRWVDYLQKVEPLADEIINVPIMKVIDEIKNKRGVAFLDDVIAMLPKQFATRDARNLCQLLKGKPQEFQIFHRHLEKDDKIRLVKLAEAPSGKGRPARIYEKL